MSQIQPGADICVSADSESVDVMPMAGDQKVSLVNRLAMLYRERRDLVLGLVSVAALLTVWQFVVDHGYFDEFFASKPSAIAGGAWYLIDKGIIASEIGTTATGFLAGFALAIAVGVPLGILVG